MQYFAVRHLLATNVKDAKAHHGRIAAEKKSIARCCDARLVVWADT